MMFNSKKTKKKNHKFPIPIIMIETKTLFEVLQYIQYIIAE